MRVNHVGAGCAQVRDQTKQRDQIRPERDRMLEPGDDAHPRIGNRPSLLVEQAAAARKKLDVESSAQPM